MQRAQATEHRYRTARGPGKRERRRGSAAFTAVLAVLLLLPGGRIGAGEAEIDLGYSGGSYFDPRLLVGEWIAIIMENDFPQPVRLEIHRTEPGKSAGKMTYSSPRRCFLDLEYGGPHEASHIFYIIPFTNCFEYGASDYVAISMIGDSFLAGAAPRRPGTESSGKAAPAERLPRVRYVLVTDKTERESGVLNQK